MVKLGAQKDVRYSIEHSRSYIDSNASCFFNILEACRVVGFGRNYIVVDAIIFFEDARVMLLNVVFLR